MTEQPTAQTPNGGDTPSLTPPVIKSNTEPPKPQTVEEQVKALSEQTQIAVKAAEASAQVATEMKGALQEEREKRKTAQQELDELRQKVNNGGGEPPKPPVNEDPLKDFDPEEVETFKKVAAATGVVFKSDIEAETALRQQKQQEEGNLSAYSSFLTINKALFGEDGKATEEQEANFKTFSQYVRDTFDIDKDTILKTPNLSKKLDAALAILTNSANNSTAREQGRNEGMAAIRNNQMLAVGGGAGSGAGGEGGGEWKRSTPEAVVRANMARAGYPQATIDEMIAREKKS